MIIKLDIRCWCGKPLKGNIDFTYADPKKGCISVRPCPQCLKEAKVQAHTDGMIERDHQITAAKKREER